MDTHNSVFYKNKRVIAESVVPTAIWYPPTLVKIMQNNHLDFYLVILEIILNILLNKNSGTEG